MEKAERNVLPVLNNLLENREMQLDDGRFLMAAARYDKLLEVGDSKPHRDPKYRLLPLSKNKPPVAPADRNGQQKGARSEMLYLEAVWKELL